MTPQEFTELLKLGHEVRGVEFKGPSVCSDKPFRARVIRSLLAMANHRGGGRTIIGVSEVDSRPCAAGLSPEEVLTWNHDDLTSAVSEYADPYLSLRTEQLVYEGKSFIVIHVDEFDQIPVLCRREYQDVLRKGACYVRRLGKPESSEIPTAAEMRDLIELATEKGLRRFFHLAHAAGLEIARRPDTEAGDTEAGDTDEERFRLQRERNR